MPPRMPNPAQFGNLKTSAVEMLLVNTRRRCKACVVFFCARTNVEAPSWPHRGQNSNIVFMMIVALNEDRRWTEISIIVIILIMIILIMIILISFMRLLCTSTSQ